MVPLFGVGATRIVHYREYPHPRNIMLTSKVAILSYHAAWWPGKYPIHFYSPPFRLISSLDPNIP